MKLHSPSWGSPLGVLLLGFSSWGSPLGVPLLAWRKTARVFGNNAASPTDQLVARCPEGTWKLSAGKWFSVSDVEAGEVRASDLIFRT